MEIPADISKMMVENQINKLKENDDRESHSIKEGIFPPNPPGWVELRD